MQLPGDKSVKLHRKQCRLRQFHHIGVRCNEPTHIHTPVAATPQDLTQALILTQHFAKRLENGFHPCHGIVYLMGDHPYHLTVSLLLGTMHFVGKQVYHDERPLEATVHKP